MGSPALAWVAVSGALAALGIAVIGFLGVTEDVTAHNGLATSDASHLRLFTGHRTVGLIHLSRLATEAGAVMVLVPLALAMTVLLWWRRTPLALAVAPLSALIGTAMATMALKHLVGRMRPPAGLHLVRESEPSFPSGHTADSTAFYVALAVVVAAVVLHRPLARIAVVAAGTAIAIGVGISRLFLGVHWPTDVIAGWTLGAAVALGVVLLATLVVRVGGSGQSARSGRLVALIRLGGRRRGASSSGALSSLPRFSDMIRHRYELGAN